MISKPQMKFSTKQATNPDNIMYDWNKFHLNIAEKNECSKLHSFDDWNKIRKRERSRLIHVELTNLTSIFWTLQATETIIFGV